MSERYAIYYVPPVKDELFARASAWLGNSLYPDRGTGPEIPPSLKLFQHNTVKASQYGFHATLKPPFRLRPGYPLKRLKKMLRHFAALMTPIECSPLSIQELARFLVLMPQQDCAELRQLARDCVQTFELFRAPLTEHEIQQRKPNNLSARQRSLLYRWGYPYVLDEFRFHLTLTDKINDTQRRACRAQLEEFLGPALDRPFRLAHISLCHQPAPGARFTLIDRYALTGAG